MPGLPPGVPQAGLSEGKGLSPVFGDVGFPAISS
jgi:hypothetical protein